jgi:hypothetical protein
VGRFSGAALYVVSSSTGADELRHKIAATEFVPSYKRRCHAGLTGGRELLAGPAAWRLGAMSDGRGAVLIGLAVPYTLIIVKPTNGV